MQALVNTPLAGSSNKLRFLNGSNWILAALIAITGSDPCSSMTATCSRAKRGTSWVLFISVVKSIELDEVAVVGVDFQGVALLRRLKSENRKVGSKSIRWAPKKTIQTRTPHSTEKHCVV